MRLHSIQKSNAKDMIVKTVFAERKALAASLLNIFYNYHFQTARLK